MKEPDGVKPSIFYKSEMGAGDCHDRDKMAVITLARWMWFVDIVVEKDFEQRSKGILQILMGRSCLILEVSTVVKGM